MHTCLRISDAAALALHSMGVLAASPDEMLSNQTVATRLKVSEHHLAKVHQRLVRAGLVRAIRGPHGGFQLARPAREITLLEIVQAVEGPFAPTTCLLGRTACVGGHCVMGEFSQSLNQQVRDFLAGTTADSLVH
jgi:Rrf2 family protein